MNKFVQHSQHVMYEGFKCKDLENYDVTVKVIPILCSVNSVARPIIPNRMQYNGFCSCSWC